MADIKEGTVTWLSDTGLVLDNEKGPDGKYVYRNFTKPEYRAKEWDEPNKGDHVKLALNNGWIQAIKRVSAAVNGATPTTYASGTTEEGVNRRAALAQAVLDAVGTEHTAEDTVLRAEFFLTFLQPSEQPPAGNPFDGDPGPESPFE